jgi:hypothetical protein
VSHAWHSGMHVVVRYKVMATYIHTYCMECLLSGPGAILCFKGVFFSPKPVSLRRCRRMRFRENQNRYVSIGVLETSFLQTMDFISLLVLPFLHPSPRTCVSIGVLETPFLQTMVFVSLLVLPFWHRPPRTCVSIHVLETPFLQNIVFISLSIVCS